MTVTKKKEDYKDHFTINTGKWLESRGFDAERIYRALNNENIELNTAEKKLVNDVLKLNSNTGKWFKPIGLEDNLTNPIKSTAKKTEEVKYPEPELVPIFPEKKLGKKEMVEEPQLIPIPERHAVKTDTTKNKIEIDLEDVFNFYNKSELNNACASFVKAALNVNGYAVPHTTKTDVDAWHMGKTLEEEGFTRSNPGEISLEKLPIGTVICIRHPTSRYRETADQVEGKGNGFTHVAIVVEIDGKKKIADFRNGRTYITEIDTFNDTNSKTWFNMKNAKLVMVPDETTKTTEITFDKDVLGRNPIDTMWNSFQKNETNSQIAAVSAWTKQKRLASGKKKEEST